MLFRSANNGAKGNAATNMVIKPYWITETQQNIMKMYITVKHIHILSADKFIKYSVRTTTY